MYFGVISTDVILKAMELYEITKKEIYVEKKRGPRIEPQDNATSRVRQKRRSQQRRLGRGNQGGKKESPEKEESQNPKEESVERRSGLESLISESTVHLSCFSI